MNHSTQMDLRSFPRLIGRPLVALALFGLTFLAGCTADEQHDLVARSDTGNVTRADLEAYILSLPEGQRRPAKGQELSEWRRIKAENLVTREALIAETEAMADEAELDVRLEQVRGMVLADAFEEESITSQINITEDQVRAYYEEHKHEFGNKEQIRLRHIFRRVSGDASDSDRAAARAEMELLVEELRGGANFGDLAKERSDSDTAHLHGLIGRLDRGSLDPALEEIVWNLEDGEISDVVATPVGFHIFRLDDFIPAAGVTYEEARGRLIRRLEKHEKERLEAEIFEELLAESGASYHPELIGDDSAAADEELLAIDTFVVRVADAQNHERQSKFIERRTAPASTWLYNLTAARLYLWKAEQEGLADRPEIAAKIKEAERRERYDIARERRLEGIYQELEADGTLEAHWDANYRRFQTPKLHRLRIIVSSFEGLDRPYDAYEKLAAIATKIRAGSLDMAEAARLFSDDASAVRGGNIGFIRLNGFGLWAGPRIQNAIARMDEGELSEPMLLENYDPANLQYDQPGYILLRVEEIKDPEVLPYEDSSDQVREHYYTQYPQEIEGKMRREVLAAVHAEIFEGNL